MYASPRPKPIFKFCQISSVQSRQAFPFRKNRYKSEFTVVSLVANRRASMIYRLRSRVGLRGRDASINDSVGYELRGKLGVPLRFLSRTAQPPKQSSPKEAMALNASHAIKFSLRKTSVKSHKTWASSIERIATTVAATTTTWPNGKRPRWSTSDLRSSSSQRYIGTALLQRGYW